MPTELLKLAPYMKLLMAAAQEYDAIGVEAEALGLEREPFTIVEWVRWLDVEVRSAVAAPYAGAVGVVQPLRTHRMTISR